MKVHLVKSEESLIKGYKPIVLLPTGSLGKLNNLNILSDNECEFILANDTLDEFSRQEIPEVIQMLIKKLRINGTLVLGGTDIRVFCKSVINSTIDENQASEIIRAKQSMTNIQDILSLLQSTGLKIQSSQITGTHYEITAVRN